MPTHRNKQALFIRWLWLVYLPLALFGLGMVLMFFNLIGGGLIWAVGLLAIYCVIPVRLLLETRRKGLELPRPPSKRKPSAAARKAAPAAASAPEAPTARARVTPPVSPQIRRRRAVAGVVGIGVVALIGGILFILGMGRASSGSMGLLLIGVGGFLMLLSVTLPTFKLVDITLRAVGRLMSRKPRTGPPRRTTN